MSKNDFKLKLAGKNNECGLKDFDTQKWLRNFRLKIKFNCYDLWEWYEWWIEQDVNDEWTISWMRYAWWIESIWILFDKVDNGW